MFIFWVIYCYLGRFKRCCRSYCLLRNFNIDSRKISEGSRICGIGLPSCARSDVHMHFSIVNLRGLVWLTNANRYGPRIFANARFSHQSFFLWSNRLDNGLRRTMKQPVRWNLWMWRRRVGYLLSKILFPGTGETIRYRMNAWNAELLLFTGLCMCITPTHYQL